MDANNKCGSKNRLHSAEEALLYEAESLIWDLLDDSLEPSGVKRLETLIRDHSQVRDRYASCVQLHTDLQSHYGKSAPPKKAPASPVLRQLGDVHPGANSWLPVDE